MEEEIGMINVKYSLVKKVLAVTVSVCKYSHNIIQKNYYLLIV